MDVINLILKFKKVPDTNAIMFGGKTKKKQIMFRSMYISLGAMRLSPKHWNFQNSLRIDDKMGEPSTVQISTF